ncbi:MAG: hypothetical protein WAM60_19175 [Candidatus Promineifilaceae bacterium]
MNALFNGLVYDEQDNLVEVAHIGSDAHYVVDDGGFHRHINAEVVDRQVLQVLLQQLEENKDIAIEQALNFLGKDDLLTKAAVDASMRNVNIDQILKQGIPGQARDMMGMVGFRIIINLHGEVVRIDQPAVPYDE